MWMRLAAATISNGLSAPAIWLDRSSDPPQKKSARKNDFDKETLCNIWLAALHSVGLSGVGDIAFDLIEARSAESYLTKISSEMVLGALKDGRSRGSYAPFQLLAEIADGASWAIDRFVELKVLALICARKLITRTVSHWKFSTMMMIRTMRINDKLLP